MGSPGLATFESPECLTCHEVGGRSCSELVAKLRRRSSKMGLLWQQRDRVFSRWRERLFFLTADSLISIDTEGRRLGDHACIEVPLVSIERVELEERRGRLTLLIVSREEGR